MCSGCLSNHLWVGGGWVDWVLTDGVQVDIAALYQSNPHGRRLKEVTSWDQHMDRCPSTSHVSVCQISLDHHGYPGGCLLVHLAVYLVTLSDSKRLVTNCTAIITMQAAYRKQ